MKELREFSPLEKGKMNLHEKKEKLFLASLDIKFGRRGFKNANGRIYNDVEEAFNEYNQRANAQKIISTVDHPLGIHPSLKDASHVVEKVYLSGDDFRAKIKLLDTSKGRDILKILKSGIPVGASSRGTGKLDASGNVQDYRISGVDFVQGASFGAHAEVTQANILSESVQVSDTDLNAIKEEILQNVENKFGTGNLTEDEEKALYNSIAEHDPNVFKMGFKEFQKKSKVKKPSQHEIFLQQEDDLAKLSKRKCEPFKTAYKDDE